MAIVWFMLFSVHQWTVLLPVLQADDRTYLVIKLHEVFLACATLCAEEKVTLCPVINDIDIT
jgi:hypothetical protein